MVPLKWALFALLFPLAIALVRLGVNILKTPQAHYDHARQNARTTKIARLGIKRAALSDEDVEKLL